MVLGMLQPDLPGSSGAQIKLYGFLTLEEGDGLYFDPGYWKKTLGKQMDSANPTCSGFCCPSAILTYALTAAREGLTNPLIKGMPALAGVAQWIEHGLVNQRVAGSVPSQGTCLGCGPGP